MIYDELYRNAKLQTYAAIEYHIDFNGNQFQIWTRLESIRKQALLSTKRKQKTERIVLKLRLQTERKWVENKCGMTQGLQDQMKVSGDLKECHWVHS